jgi:hypothetical protein
MKTFGLAIAWGVLLSGALAADTYRINFTGTITNGTAKDFNLNTNALETVADLTGLQVSGWMDFNLGAAPAAVVSVDNSGFTNTLIQSIGGPIFVSEHFVIGGFTPPTAGFLPMPTPFDLAPVPSLPSGTIVTQNQDNQTLRFSTKPVLGPQTVIPGMNFMYSSTGPQASGSDDIALNLLISSAVAGPHFFAVPPAGDIPTSWGPVTTGTNGVFTLSQRSQNPTIPDHFGLTTDYSVIGGFTIDSASGGFLAAPEPSAVAPTAFGLVLVAVGAFFRDRPRRRVLVIRRQGSRSICPVGFHAPVCWRVRSWSFIGWRRGTPQIN